MTAATYRAPVLPVGTVINECFPENLSGTELLPETMVFVFHRGSGVIEDMFDGLRYLVQPGWQQIPYAAAMHFQSRAVIKGSREIETGSFDSYLVIPREGGDQMEWCVPLTSEESQVIDARVEAIDRTGQPGAFKVEQTAIVRGRQSNQAVGSRARRPMLDGSTQATPLAAEAAAYAMKPPSGGEAAAVSAGRVGGEA